MSRALSNREKVLSALVGGSVLLVVNLFLFDFFNKNRLDLARQDRAKTMQLANMKALLASSSQWEQRDAWLKAKQPVLENEATAGVALRNQIRDAATRETVAVEGENLGDVDKRPYCTAVALTFETKSTWKSLINFLAALQGPDKFLVVETTELRVDANDQTQMRGVFRVAKWYAPK